MAKKDTTETKLNLKERLLKNSTLKYTSMLSESDIFNKSDNILFDIPMLNVAFSGSLDLGFTSGVTTFAGESKRFKSKYLIKMIQTYLEKYPDGMALVYDSEFGTPKSYWTKDNIDMSKIIHSPVLTIEELKIDIVNQLEGIKRGDHLFVGIDSIGNLASKKETQDALDGKDTVDMTRAKQLKSFFRVITSHFKLKDIPLVVINHTYKTLELYSKDVVGGGTGGTYSSDNIFIIGRQQDKDKTSGEVYGYDFILKTEKSRYVKEGSKIPISVSFEFGISKYSGLLENALESGHVVSPKQGNYAKVDIETGEFIEGDKTYKENDTNTDDFWGSILSDDKFKKFIETKYRME